jgi:hypothetical protein
MEQKKVFCADNHDQGAPSCNRVPGGGMVGQPVQRTGKNGLAGSPVNIQWQVQYLPNNGGVRYIDLDLTWMELTYLCQLVPQIEHSAKSDYKL